MSEAGSPPEVSAIVLCYRAGEAVREVVEPLHAELTGEGLDFELVLVGNYDAGVEDPTPAALRRIAARLPGVRTVIAEKRGGMGWDMRRGLDAARGDVLVVIDGDGQFGSHDVLRAYEELRRSGAPLVKGRRTSREDGAWRRFQSRIYNLVVRLLFPRAGLRDVNSKPKGMTRAAYERLELVSDDWFVDAEMMLGARRQGLAVAEIPVEFGANRQRDSFVDLGTAFEFVHHLLRYRLRGRP